MTFTHKQHQNTSWFEFSIRQAILSWTGYLFRVFSSTTQHDAFRCVSRFTFSSALSPRIGKDRPVLSVCFHCAAAAASFNRRSISPLVLLFLARECYLYPAYCCTVSVCAGMAVLCSLCGYRRCGSAVLAVINKRLVFLCDFCALCSRSQSQFLSLLARSQSWYLTDYIRFFFNFSPQWTDACHRLWVWWYFIIFHGKNILDEGNENPGFLT